MSGASSTVWSMVKSGAISTMPPTLAAAMMASTKPMADALELAVEQFGHRVIPAGIARQAPTGTSARALGASGHRARTVIQML